MQDGRGDNLESISEFDHLQAEFYKLHNRVNSMPSFIFFNCTKSIQGYMYGHKPGSYKKKLQLKLK